MNDDGFLRSPKWLRSWPVEDRLRNAKVPKIFRSLTTEFEEAPSGATLRWLNDYDRGKLLLLHSLSGVESARKAAWLVGELIRKGESARWVAADNYIELYKDEWNDDSEGEFWRELKYMAKGYDVLVIDGLGEEPNTEFERKILAALIRSRHERELTTIVTSPYNQVELGQYGGRVGQYFIEGDKISGRK